MKASDALDCIGGFGVTSLSLSFSPLADDLDFLFLSLPFYIPTFDVFFYHNLSPRRC